MDALARTSEHLSSPTLMYKGVGQGNPEEKEPGT